ncbi:hypothetical protein [Halorubrum sp. CBA1125]|uniref:DUF7266 family protein n=1 Tax=Halorubrum sp. CBA1125 TaxID=2668072 RepID=UPI002AA2B44F|nr:hypothetical protein [Halorubrum sp. CBA1125]
MSVTVGYVLTLAIGAVLLSGVVIAVGGVVDAQTDRAVRGELSVLGQTTAANLESADRLVRAAEADNRPDASADATVSVAFDLPTRVAGIPYRIAVDDESVVLHTDRPDVRVEVPHAVRSDVEATSVRGGPLRVTYTSAGSGRLEVSER